MTVLGKRAMSPANDSREEQTGSGKKCRVASFFPQNDYTSQHTNQDDAMQITPQDLEEDDFEDEDDNCCVVSRPTRSYNTFQQHHIDIPAYTYQQNLPIMSSVLAHALSLQYPSTPMDTEMDMSMSTPQPQKASANMEKQTPYPPVIYPEHNGPTQEETIAMGCWYGQWQAQGGHF